mmetsp:Transcript_29727/g.78952  ORF Transcript_29727/g.78952 Transcript_29727/m.78952 type:complete len:206 (-) Transcript_29727:842-1459(-)
MANFCTWAENGRHHFPKGKRSANGCYHVSPSSWIPSSRFKTSLSSFFAESGSKREIPLGAGTNSACVEAEGSVTDTEGMLVFDQSFVQALPSSVSSSSIPSGMHKTAPPHAPPSPQFLSDIGSNSEIPRGTGTKVWGSPNLFSVASASQLASTDLSLQASSAGKRSSTLDAVFGPASSTAKTSSQNCVTPTSGSFPGGVAICGIH